MQRNVSAKLHSAATRFSASRVHCENAAWNLTRSCKIREQREAVSILAWRKKLADTRICRRKFTVFLSLGRSYSDYFMRRGLFFDSVFTRRRNVKRERDEEEGIRWSESDGANRERVIPWRWSTRYPDRCQASSISPRTFPGAMESNSGFALPTWNEYSGRRDIVNSLTAVNSSGRRNERRLN